MAKWPKDEPERECFKQQQDEMKINEDMLNCYGERRRYTTGKEMNIENVLLVHLKMCTISGWPHWLFG